MTCRVPCLPHSRDPHLLDLAYISRVRRARAPPGTPPACLLSSAAATTSQPRASSPRDGVRQRGGGARGTGARAPSLHGGAELGDGGGGLRAGGRRPGLQAALPARRLLLPGRRGDARAHHQGAQGPHVPVARRLLPRRRPRAPRRGRGGRRAPAPVHQVQRLRRAHRRGQVRPGHGRVVERRQDRPRQAALLRQGARAGALLLAAALRADHKLQMRRAGAGLQLGTPHRRRGVGRHLLQLVGEDPEREEAGRDSPDPGEQDAGPLTSRRRGAALREGGRTHRGPLAGLRQPRNGVPLVPHHGSDAQEAPAAGAPRGRRHLRARLRAAVADGGEGQVHRGGEDGDRGQDRRGRPERQVPGQPAEGRVRGDGLGAGEGPRLGARGAAGQERRRRDRRGRGVPGRRPRLRRRQPDARGHGEGGRVRAGDQGPAARSRGVRHGRRRRGGRGAGAARRRRPRPPRHGSAAPGRDRKPPRRARERAAAARLRVP